jgi:hypothetical protein
MPARHKFSVSVLVVLLTAALVLWQGSPLRPDLANVVIAFAGISLLVLWLFPETGVRE